MTLLEESNYVAKRSALDVTAGKTYQVRVEASRFRFKDDAGDERTWTTERFLSYFQIEELSSDEVFRNALLQL